MNMISIWYILKDNMRFFPKKYQLAKQKFDKVSHLPIIKIRKFIPFRYLLVDCARIKIISLKRKDMCDGYNYENAFIDDKIIFRRIF
jgi:hypothetical protein